MKNKILILYKKDGLNILLLTIISTFFSFYGISRNSFGLDEAYTVEISKNLNNLMGIIWNKEANMWLFYVILHFWLGLGTNELAVRSLSALFAILSVLVVYKIGCFLKNPVVGLISGLLLSVNILFVFYAQFARDYSFMLFITALSSYFFLKYGKTKSGQIPFIISSIVSLYVHFYAVFTLMAQFATSLATGKAKKFLMPLVVSSLFILPIIISPSFHSGQVNWIMKPVITSIIGTALVLTGDFPPLLVVYGILLLLSLTYFIKQWKDFGHNYLFMLLLVPIITCFALSTIAKPIYQSVYFVGSLIPVVLLTGLVLERIRNKIIRLTILSLMLILSMIRLFMWTQGITQYKWIITNKSDDFRGAERYVSQYSKKGDVLIFYGYYAKAPFEAYNKNAITVKELTDKEYALGGGAKLPNPDMHILDSLHDKDVWLVSNRNTGSLFEREKQFRSIETELLKVHKLVIKKQFFGVGVEEFLHR